MSHLELIKNLNYSEKIQLMEELWNEIRNDSEYNTPSWHKDILEERDEALSTGKIGVSEWTKAKSEIRSSVS